MASVDDLFRKPNAPSSLSNGKRKFEAPSGHAAYKSAKTSSGADVKHSHAATVEDDTSDQDPTSDTEAGPALPPDEDGEESPSDDEEGRFFGSGMTSSSRSALAYLDSAEDGNFADEAHDGAWARRLAVGLERKALRNAEQRAKHEAEPARFMGSEADLDAEIKGLSILTEHAELYADFCSAGGAKGLVGLLAHDNADIAIAALEVIAELVDEDVEVQQEQWDTLVAAMLEADLDALLVQNFERFDEAADESDRQGVYHSLAVMEALGSNAAVVEKAGTETTIAFLLNRIQAKEEGTSQNKQYAAEVLQVFLQDSPTLRKRAIKLGGMDALLQMLAAYRRKDPESNSLEEEYVSNLFNALVCLVRETKGKTAFVQGEGVELMLIMLREGKMSKSEALKVLDHATVGDGQAVCARIVEAAGLKPIFGLFKKKLDRQETENLLDIVSALLRLLPGEGAERIRTLAKFAEKNHEKISKLLEWRKKFQSELTRVDAEVARERKLLSADEQEEQADEWELRRMDAGLFGLQTVDTVLAWLAAEDQEARAKMQSAGASMEDLRNGLKTQLADVDPGADEDHAEMLQALIDAL